MADELSTCEQCGLTEAIPFSQRKQYIPVALAQRRESAKAGKCERERKLRGPKCLRRSRGPFGSSREQRSDFSVDAKGRTKACFTFRSGNFRNFGRVWGNDYEPWIWMYWHSFEAGSKVIQVQVANFLRQFAGARSCIYFYRCSLVGSCHNFNFRVSPPY